MKLIFEESISSASLKVKWELTPDLVENLNKTDDVKYIALVISYGTTPNDDYDVAIRKLSDGVAYPSLRKAGEINVKAYVFGTDMNIYMTSEKELTNFLSPQTIWASPILEGIINDNEFENRTVEMSTGLKLRFWEYSKAYVFEVPEQSFASPYPRWLNFLINRHTDAPPKDECQRRQRLLTLMLFKIWIIIFEVIFIEIAFIANVLLLWFIGHYNIRYGYIFKPFEYVKIGDYFDGIAKGSHILVKLFGKNFFDNPTTPLTFRHVTKTILFSLLATPLTPIVLVITTILTHFIVPIELTFVELIGLTYIWTSVMVLLIQHLGGILVGIKMFFESIIDTISSIEFKNDINYNNKIYVDDDSQISKRPLRLIYEDLKHKICKPLSR